MMKTLDKKTEGSYKKVKETEEEARSPPASDEGSGFENVIRVIFQPIITSVLISS
jgi:hypothetical protein